MTSIRRLGWTTLALFALAGCDQPAAAPPTVGLPDAGQAATEPPKAPTETKALPVEKLSDEEVAEIKKLPAEEQPIALAQLTCPVSGDHLGAMDKPIKQVIGDKTFYICCSGCEKAVKSKPEEVLAKLKK